MLDITGQKFGKLTAISRTKRQDKSGCYYWKFRCDCGNIMETTGTSAKRGHTNSCGCSNKEQITKLGKDRRTHGDTNWPDNPIRLYRIWANMRHRCNIPTMPAYRRYGGRGISVCDEWNDYSVFRDWANSSGYEDWLTIDRIDNDGNYCPSNCQWITREENIRKDVRRKS